MRRWLLLAVAGCALLLLVGRVLAGVYAEWTWFAAMGALPLYRSRLLYESVLRGAAAAAGFVLAFGNLYAVRSSIVSLVLPRRLGNIEIGEAVPGRLLTTMVLAVSVVIAVLLALPQDDWTTFALARIGVPFNEFDPYNDREFGYYVYQLPFERSIYLWALAAVLVVSAVVVILYAITPSLRWERGRIYVSAYVRRHFAVLAAIVLALVAWSYRIEAMSLVFSGSGAGGAFTAYDHRIAIPLLTALSIAPLAASLLVLWSGWHGHHRVTFAVLTLILVVGPGLRAALPVLARWQVSASGSRSRERPYLTTRTLFTRRAFGVDAIVNGDSARAAPLARYDLARDVSTWDPAALVRSADAEQRGATAAFAWLPSPGGLTAVLAFRARDGERDWTVDATDATTADERGHPLPRMSPAPDDADAMPNVLVFDGASEYALVADTSGRVAAPPFENWKERLGHAWHLQNPRLLVAEPPGPRPRIVFHRDVRDRVATLAPFFTPGPTLQAIVAADSLYWVLDLFDTSDQYPLSEPILFAGASRHYVHHAATAIVQAQTGRVTLVVDARPDAIARSWIRRFPELFVTHDQLPAALDALRPPSVDWSTVQGLALSRTGFPGDTTQPQGLARADDADLSAGAPTFFLSRSGDRGTLVWSTGVVDAGERVVGVLSSRGGPAPRTEWRRSSRAMRWNDVLERLQHAADSAGFGRQRRFSRRGRVQVLPTAGGVTFVQSFYEWPSDGPPALAGVATLENGQTHTGATLSDALGLARPPADGGSTPFRARVTALYEEMRTAMRRGDWRAFGAAWAEFGRLLRSGR